MYPFFDWEPVKLFEKWCNMLMFAFAKNDFGCTVLIDFYTGFFFFQSTNKGG